MTRKIYPSLLVSLISLSVAAASVAPAGPGRSGPDEEEKSVQIGYKLATEASVAERVSQAIRT